MQSDCLIRWEGKRRGRTVTVTVIVPSWLAFLLFLSERSDTCQVYNHHILWSGQPIKAIIGYVLSRNPESGLGDWNIRSN